MQINLLKKGYRNNESIYKDFIENNVNFSKEYFSEDIVYFEEIPDFPIYTPNNKVKFIEAVEILKESKLMNKDRDIHLDGTFWHSFLITQKRDYIVESYPQVLTNKKDFYNIVFKNFDWENYIYKFLLASEYIYDFNLPSKKEESRYIEIIYDNLDLFNYLIKYNLFRNNTFIMNILTIVDEEDLSGLLKAKIKDRPDLGSDERYGRRVVYELNKNYPSVMYPLLPKDELRNEIKKALRKYI